MYMVIVNNKMPYIDKLEYTNIALTIIIKDVIFVINRFHLIVSV